MLPFFIIIIILSIFEIFFMLKNKNYKELFLYCGLLIIVIILGIIYFSSPYTRSISHFVLNLLGIEH